MIRYIWRVSRPTAGEKKVCGPSVSSISLLLAERLMWNVRGVRERGVRGAATGIWNAGAVCINKVLSKQRKFYSELIASAHFLYDQSENHSIGKSIFSMFDSL